MKQTQLTICCLSAIYLFLGLNSQIFAQQQCGTCYEQRLGVSLTNRANIDICENFNNYSTQVAFPATTNTQWKLWDNTSDRPSIQLNQGSQALRMLNTGGKDPDVLLLLGNRNSGRYRLSWEIFVSANKRASYNIQHTQSGGANPNWAFEVSFEANGMGYLHIADQAKATKQDSFNYVNGGVNQVMQIIDLNKDRVELWINHEYVAAWDFSRGTTPSKVLGSVNFYADTNCDFFIDNICLWRAVSCQASLIYSPVCLKSGIQYDNSSLATCDLYTSKEFTSKPCENETVCNYGGNFIEIEGPPAQGRLESGLLPSSLVNENCIREVFGNKSPGQLYGEIFVFPYDGEKYGKGIGIGINWTTKVGKSRAFIFKCNCDEPTTNLCFQNCTIPKNYVPPKEPNGEHLITNIPFDETKKTFYYVVLLSDTPTDFSLTLSSCVDVIINGSQDSLKKSKLGDEFCTLCLTNTPTILSCNTPLNGNLRNQGSEFSTNGSSVYSNCVRSIRNYDGEDLVHKFTLTVPTRITLTLNGFSTQMGMFLYNQYCGQNCMASGENSSSGGTTSIGPVDLDAGDYYVIVDKDSPLNAGNTNYTLELKCEEDQSPDFQYDEIACPTASTNPHIVRIRAVEGLLMDNLSLTQRDKINFVYDKGQGNYVLESGKFWNAEELIFQFFADQPGDGIKCGYAPNDSFDIRIIKEQRNFKVKPIFTSSTAGKFNPGAQSIINRFQIIGIPSNLRVSPAFKEVDANANTFPITFKVLVQSDIKWEMSGLGSWVQAIRGTGNKDDELTINVLSPNPNASPRVDTLILLGQNKELRRIVIRQKGCAAARANLGENFNVCQGDRVTLTPQGTGNYIWGDGSLGTTFTFTANVVGPTTYQVKSTVSGCTATARVTVNVRPKPVVALGDNRSVCAGTPLTITPQIVGTSPYVYSWSTGVTLNSISVSATGKYSLKIVDGNGCTGIGEVSVNFKPLPIANAGLDQSICAGQNAPLRASGGTSYRWSNNATSAETSVSPVTSTNFTVTVTQDGCDAIDEVHVTVKPLPTANAGLDQSICEGQNAILRASGGTSYRWSNNVSSTEISVNPTTSTNFTVTVTQDGCEASDQVLVTVKPLPTANAGLDQNICEGQNAILRASGGTSYRWSNNATSAEISVNPGTSTNFTVTVTQDGCEASDQVHVTVKSLPIANAGLDQSICEGQNAILRASGGTSYRWSNNSTSAEISVNPGTSTNFTVTVTQDGCEASDQVRVTVKSLPIANAGLDQSICAGQSALLRASGGTSYRWSNNSTSAEISVNPGTSTNFTVTVTQDGCDAIDQVRVTVKSQPTANAGLDQSICEGQNAILRASGGTSYRWSNNSTSAEISVNPGTSTNFTVTVTQDGCDAIDQVRVTVKSLPIANAGLDQSICEGQNAILRASGGTSYRWSNNATSAEISINPATSTNFTVTVTQDGCEATDQVLVAVKSLPTANAGLDQSICAGQNAVLRASGGTSYRWSNNSTSAEISVNPTTSTNFTVTVTQDGCEATDQVLVAVKSLPTANAGLDQSICAGQNAVLRASGGTSYRWSNNATSTEISINPATSTNYTVTVTRDGCEATDEIRVTVKPLPVANAGLDQSICAGQNAILRASGGTSYRWSNNVSSAEISVSPGTSTNFTVTVTQDGCEATDEVRVTVKPLPIANAGLDQSICAGQNAVLRASGGTSYRWSNNATVAEITVNPTTSSIFTVTVTQDGCEGSDRVEIKVNPNPSVMKESVHPAAGESGNIQVKVSGGTPGYQFQWFRNDTLISTQEDLIGLRTGIFKLIVTDANGCKATYGPELITRTLDLEIPKAIQVFPNPNDGKFNIQFHLEQNTFIEINILDALGRKVLWSQGRRGFKEETLAVDLSTHTPGIYLIQFKTGQLTFYKKIIRQ